MQKVTERDLKNEIQDMRERYERGKEKRGKEGQVLDLVYHLSPAPFTFAQLRKSATVQLFCDIQLSIIFETSRWLRFLRG